MAHRTGQPPKYEPLRRFLVAAVGDTLTLSFAEIEAIIDAPLPTSASTRTWWGNAREVSQTQAWLDASWRVASVNLFERTVTFVREPASCVSQYASNLNWRRVGAATPVGVGPASGVFPLLRCRPGHRWE